MAAKKAGIEKEISLHTFRHSRITHLLPAGMSESVVKMLAWGDISITMVKIYSHLTPGDVENAFNSMYGIKSVEEFKGMDPAVSLCQCQICGMLNPPGNRFCGGCGAALTREVGDNKVQAFKAVLSGYQGMDEGRIRQIFLKMKEAGEI